MKFKIKGVSLVGHVFREGGKGFGLTKTNRGRVGLKNRSFFGRHIWNGQAFSLVCVSSYPNSEHEAGRSGEF